jgi:hypothetical protein
MNGRQTAPWSAPLSEPRPPTAMPKYRNAEMANAEMANCEWQMADGRWQMTGDH